TVLPDPSPNQRRIVERLGDDADELVVQSNVARERLIENYGVDPKRVTVIPHGARRNLAFIDQPADPTRRPVILTWGLISSGKGIEHAINAMAELKDLDPLPRYIIQGETHPKVVAQSGEAYREALKARVQELGVENMVEFEDGYKDTAAILA